MKTKSKQIKDFSLAAEMLKAIAHPLRLRILVLLCRQDLHVNALAERLDLNQSIVSQQLRILRMRDLVAAKRENGFALYRIAEPHVREIVRCLASCQAERGVSAQ